MQKYSFNLSQLSLKRLELLQRIVSPVEDEGKNVLPLLHSLAHKRTEIRFVGDLQRHLTTGSGHLELHIFAALVGGLGEVEGDAAEWELEGDFLVVDRA